MHSHSASFMTRKFEILLFSSFLSISSILTDVLGNQPIQKIFLFPSAFSRKDFWLSLAQIFGWYKRDETSHETRSKHWFALWPVKSASLAKVLATKLVCRSKFVKVLIFHWIFQNLRKNFQMILFLKWSPLIPIQHLMRIISPHDDNTSNLRSYYFRHFCAAILRKYFRND